jgi:hypothetical protein
VRIIDDVTEFKLLPRPAKKRSKRRATGYGVTNAVDAVDEDHDLAARERRRRRAARKRRAKKAHPFDPSCATCRAQRALESWPERLIVARTMSVLAFRAENLDRAPRANERVYVLAETPKKGRKR